MEVGADVLRVVGVKNIRNLGRGAIREGLAVVLALLQKPFSESVRLRWGPKSIPPSDNSIIIYIYR